MVPKSVKIEPVNFRIIDSDITSILKQNIINEALENGFMKISNTDDDGHKHVTILSEVEFEEAIEYFARRGRDRDDIGFGDIMGYLIKHRGVAHFISLLDVNDNTSISVSRGYVVFLMQEMLDCEVERVDAISSQIIGSVLGLGSNASDPSGQVRRDRRNAKKQILNYITNRKAEGNNRYVSFYLLNFITTNLKQALRFILERQGDIARSVFEKKGETLLSRLQSNPTDWLVSATKKICGHFYREFCPLAISK